MGTMKLTHDNVLILTKIMSNKIENLIPVESIKVYPVPRGGIPVAYLLKSHSQKHITIVDDPAEADILIDDLIDSGKTCLHYARLYTKKMFFALLDKRTDEDYQNKWVVFPWENSFEGSTLDIPTRFLQAINEDVNRSGLIDTPKRVVKSWEELYSGYGKNPEDVVRVFPNEEGYDELVLVKDIEFYSTCEHHILPFYGKIHVGYLPADKIIGVSKIPRIVEIFSRRLQIQERLTMQIAQALDDLLKPAGVAVYCEAIHLCMVARGIKKQNARMETSRLIGRFKSISMARSEFFDMVKKH